MNCIESNFEHNSHTKHLAKPKSKDLSSLKWDSEIKNAINYYAGWGDGCTCYRMKWHTEAINDKKLARFNDINSVCFERKFYQDYHVVKVQRYFSPLQTNHLKFLKSIQKDCDFKLIYDCDDIPLKEDIPDYNSGKINFMRDELRGQIIENMLACDRMTVCSDYMKEYFQKKINHPDIVVVPDYLPRWIFDRFYSEQKSIIRFSKNLNKPRILYAGSPMHVDQEGRKEDDFSKVESFIKKTRKDYHWIFLGTIPYKLKSFVHTGEMEFHKWVSLLQYPYRIDTLHPTAIIAPLANNHFSYSKADIKFTESAAMGIPGVFQDCPPYKDAPHKFSNVDELESRLKVLTSDENVFMNTVKEGRMYVDKFRWLESNTDKVLESYFRNW